MSSAPADAVVMVGTVDPNRPLADVVVADLTFFNGTADNDSIIFDFYNAHAAKNYSIQAFSVVKYPLVGTTAVSPRQGEPPVGPWTALPTTASRSVTYTMFVQLKESTECSGMLFSTQRQGSTGHAPAVRLLNTGQ